MEYYNVYKEMQGVLWENYQKKRIKKYINKEEKNQDYQEKKQVS